MNNFKIILIIMLVVLSLIIQESHAFKFKVNPEITEQARLVAAEKVLEKESNIVVIYVKGLCCPSCGIGIRKHIKKNNFVDTKRFNKGVNLDTKTQLITVAILKEINEKKIDIKALSQAVVDSGYIPVTTYKIVENKLVSEKIPLENTNNKISKINK